MNYRNRDLLDAVYQFPCMLRFPCCEGGFGEPAHANSHRTGKGGAMKSHDCFVVPACRPCHVYLDSGRQLNKEERWDAWETAFLNFLPELFKSGIIGVVK